MSYRKMTGTNTWHFCSNCSNWPKVNYEEQEDVPRWGALCAECKVKEVKGECQKTDAAD